MIHEPTSQLPPSPFNPYAAPSTPTQAAETENPSPLRIHTMLVLAGGILGFLLTVGPMAVTHSGFPLTPLIAVFSLMEVVKGIFAGMGAGILVDSLLQGKFSRLAPGHWQLLALLATLVAQLGFTLASKGTNVFIGETTFSAWYLVQTMIYHVLMLSLLIPIVLTTVEPRRWKVYAWCAIAISVVSVLQFPTSFFPGVAIVDAISTTMMVIAGLGAFALAIAMIVLAIVEFAIDRPRAKSRDGYHWLGIFMPVAMTVVNIVAGLAIGYVQVQ